MVRAEVCLTQGRCSGPFQPAKGLSHPIQTSQELSPILLVAPVCNVSHPESWDSISDSSFISICLQRSQGRYGHPLEF